MQLQLQLAARFCRRGEEGVSPKSRNRGSVECMFDSNSIVDSLYYYKEVYLMSLVVLPKMKTAVLSGANIVNYSTSEHLETVERYRGVLFDESTHRSASESAKRNLDSVILQSREWKRGTERKTRSWVIGFFLFSWCRCPRTPRTSTFGVWLDRAREK